MTEYSIELREQLLIKCALTMLSTFDHGGWRCDRSAPALDCDQNLKWSRQDWFVFGEFYARALGQSRAAGHVVSVVVHTHIQGQTQRTKVSFSVFFSSTRKKTSSFWLFVWTLDQSTFVLNVFGSFVCFLQKTLCLLDLCFQWSCLLG